MPVLHRWPAGDRLDDVFVRHYDRLLGWARQFVVSHDPAGAEDLVQDTFVRLALRNPDLAAIENLDGYLFVTMRNVHLSAVRRRAIRSVEVRSLLDYPSLEESLAATPANRLRQAAYDELALIAKYAAIRKATSKAASALILRFFHGYYPHEIARVLRTSDAAVDARLRIARAEAHAFIADPGKIRAFSELQVRRQQFDSETDFLSSLRASIFDSRVGHCFSAQQIDRLYSLSPEDPVECEPLAHFVSCRACLELVNSQLGLPHLKDRDPTNMSGRGPRDGGTTRTGGAAGRFRAALRARLDNALEDRPKELRIAVNGLFVGSQVVRAGVNEQRLKILISERVGFVEVFSEHGTCLLYLDVAVPPDGAVEQTASLALSGGRRLAATVRFQDEAPLLSVSYEDPAAAVGWTLPAVESVSHLREAERGLWQRLIAGLRLRPLPTSLAIGGVVIGLGIAAYVMWFSPKVSAAEVLRSTRLTEAQADVAGMATHRVLNVEDRLLPARTVIKRQRVDVWHDRSRGLQVRRLFDDRSQVVAGLWTRDDGTQTMYRVGAKPLVERIETASATLAPEDLWRHEPSAGDFTTLVGEADDATVEERADEYVVTARPNPSARGVLAVSLTVSRSQRRAVGETILLQQSGEDHEVAFTEEGIEQVPVERVLSTALQPEAALLGVPVTPPGLSVKPLATLPTAPLVTPSPRPANPSDRLELDATYRLYRARVWIGQNADINPSDGGIRVTAIVPTAQDRAAVDRSFEDRDAAMTLDVETSPPETGNTVVPLDVAAVRTIPAFGSLDAFYSNLREPARDQSVLGFATTLLRYVETRDERVRALATLADRWPEDRLRSLELESVVTWQSMVQGHAEVIRQQTELLRVQIGSVFRATTVRPVDPTPDESPSTVGAASDLIARIVSLNSTQRALLRRAFSPCAGESCSAVDVDQLLSSFAELEQAAARFDRFYLKFGRVEPAGR
jgi:RNA polymerase sigma factor (sigma-70 family)